MTPRRKRREYEATEMIPGGRNGQRSVLTRRKADTTALLEPVREPSPAERIDAALERHAPETIPVPVAPQQPEQEPARQALARIAENAHAAPREPKFTAAPPRSQRPPRRVSRPGPAAPGPVRITGELPVFAAVAAEKALPSLLWCAECGRDFIDAETAAYDRTLQFLHVRAAETGWRRDAHGLLRCPQCQQSQWVAAWRAPVLAGGVSAELALRESVEGVLPEGRREFMEPLEVTFSTPLEEAATVTYEDEGPRVRVDWKSVIDRPRRKGSQQGGRHRKQPEVLPDLSHYSRAIERRQAS